MNPTITKLLTQQKQQTDKIAKHVSFRIPERPLITFVSCWYILKSKYGLDTYRQWISNLFTIANNFNIIIFTDEEGQASIQDLIPDKSNISIIIKPFEEFHYYERKEEFQKNYEYYKYLLPELYEIISWELVLLWCEKVHFLRDAFERNIYDTPIYGWCDIGYFRNGLFDTPLTNLMSWPNNRILTELFSNPTLSTIHIGQVQCHQQDLENLRRDIYKHYIYKMRTPPNLNYRVPFYSGGFFFLHKAKIPAIATMFAQKVSYYLSNKFFIKDDQMILQDCITTFPNHFTVHTEPDESKDCWFMFQRVLMG